MSAGSRDSLLTEPGSLRYHTKGVVRYRRAHPVAGTDREEQPAGADNLT